MKNKFIAGSVLFAFVFPFLVSVSNAADIYLQLQRGQKVVIALPDFINKDSSPELLAASRELKETAKNDILFTRLFNLSESGPVMAEGKIDFEGWAKAGADILIKGTVSVSEGNVSFTGSVFEIPSGNPVFQKLYRTPARNTRRIAHEFIADFIYRFTGNRGISASRIAFSNNASGAKEIYVIDYDGKNLRRLTSDNSIAILPRWSPNKEEILFTSFKNGNPDLALFNISSGKSKMISARRGLNTSASFSPDGKSIVATLSIDGRSQLYLLDHDGKMIRCLSKSKSDETSASFSADGRKIIFVSDRAGSPQIYMMDADGSNLERLTDGGWCDSPVWSPAGDKIAYSRGDSKGHHDIIIQDVGSGKTVQVTSDSGKNENPTFSSDGKFIAFTSSREGRKQIYIASLDGNVQRKLTDIPGSCATPSWEP